VLGSDAREDSCGEMGHATTKPWGEIVRHPVPPIFDTTLDEQRSIASGIGYPENTAVVSAPWCSSATSQALNTGPGTFASLPDTWLPGNLANELASLSPVEVDVY
jgi:hypothetical protein